MTDEQIEEQQIIDRYLMGKLPPNEAARFEEHYLSCPQCLEQLEMGEKMLRGFKGLAVQRAGGAGSIEEGKGRRPALSRLGWKSALALAAVLAGLLILPPVALYMQMDTLGEQLESARQQLDQTRQLEERDRQARQTLQDELDQTRNRLSEQQQAFQAEQAQMKQQLAQERSARRRLARSLTQAFEPQANTPVFPLSPVRSSGAQPDQIIRLSSGPEWLVLSLELEGPQADSFQASLFRSGQEQPLWQSGELAPNYMDALTISFHSSFLQAGDYALRVEAPSTREAQSFTFRVVR